MHSTNFEETELPYLIMDKMNPISFGRDMSIIKIVEEHGPLAVARLSKEIEALDAKREKLVKEMLLVQALVDTTGTAKRGEISTPPRSSTE